MAAGFDTVVGSAEWVDTFGSVHQRALQDESRRSYTAGWNAALNRIIAVASEKAEDARQDSAVNEAAACEAIAEFARANKAILK